MDLKRLLVRKGEYRLVILLLVATLCFFLGVQIKYRNQYWLIAGYNYASPEEQEAVRKYFANFAGNAMIALGVLFAAMALWLRFGQKYSGVTMLFPAIQISIVATVIYRAYKTGLGTSVVPKKQNKTMLILLAVIMWPALLIIGFVAYTAISGGTTVTTEYFSVGAGITIRQNFADVESIILKEEEPAIGRKVSGTDAGRYLRGRFEAEGYGIANIHLKLGQPPYIHVLTKDGRVLIINRNNREETEALYNNMLQMWRKE